MIMIQIQQYRLQYRLESEMGEGEFQVDTGKVDAGSKSDESTTNVAASFSCEECGEKFTTRQELKEHTQVH